MDRSLDSIGSCSLDVDADSSDISDTSGSLNFPTPVSVKDITRDFTNNLRERCTLRSTQQPQYTSSAFGDPQTGLVRMVLTPAVTVVEALSSNTASVEVDVDVVGAVCVKSTPPEAITASCEKKPSYLNLACCVNGYSNLNTYDSKIRQDINKSREVSPIRPSTSGLQYCKRNHTLAAPVLHSMPLVNQPSPNSQYSSVESHNQNGLENGSSSSSGYSSSGYSNGKSFIKQRVERLYGPGALAQGFFSPKKSGQYAIGTSQSSKILPERESFQESELARKFKELSPSKDYGKFRKQLLNNCSHTGTTSVIEPSSSFEQHDNIELPVFRHLSHEFRSQLPTVSPKRTVPRSTSAIKVDAVSWESQPPPGPAPLDVVDHEPLKLQPVLAEQYNSTSKIIVPPSDKDGNYFLKILKVEQTRLLALAALADKYSDALCNNPDITEDIFGLLRSASGKARLLVSQKMKQFEGLCHNNLNRSPEDAFPTTVDDLQGFWDMVFLQVIHVDNIFADIEQLKRNEWKRSNQHQSEEVVNKSNKSAKGLKGKTPGNSNVARELKSPSANSAAALKREAQRKQLLELKRQRREAMAAATKPNQTVSDNGMERSDRVGDSSVCIKNNT